MNAQRCHKHNALVHDFFISYRVSTDSINSEKLAAHIDGKKRPDGKNFITYLDKNCLIQGKDWEDGFKYGINHSNVILLLISQGVIATMVGKARRGDEDNVLKEHRIALELLKQGRLIIPVFVASLSSTKSRRDCYIKLNREAALRQFEVEADVAATERLQQAKGVVEELFALPSFVNIEPDSISEQVPKILQLWYAEFVKKKSTNHKLNQFVTNAKKAVVQPSTLRSFFLYPSQSFRLTFIGALIGLFGFVFTLSLLFMPSKSKRHTDLKFGVALGNIVGIFVLIIVSIIYCVQFFYVSNKVHCNACESVVLDLSQSAAKYYDGIPKINTYWDDCQCDAYDDTTADCLACVCAKLYVDCENGYAASVTLLVMVGLQLLLIMGTALITHKFTKNESFSMSLSSYKV